MMSAPVEKGARPRRNRIVINLDEPGSGANSGGRSSRQGRGGRVLGLVLLLLCVIVLAVAAGVYFWWQSYRTHPAYSLAVMVNAVQQNDMQKFDGIVDTDKIVDNFVPQVTEKAAAKSATGLSAIVRRQLEGALPRVLPQAKQRVRAEIINEVKELSARAESKPFVLIALALPFVVDIKQDGDTAKATVNLKDRPVELTLQRNGPRWKVVAVKDDVLATRIADGMSKELPLFGR